ncbi:MAG: hypothetical protein A2161_18285 [Candidatus Schekmanbacteria bacterium RBG_13_48_7]|uniref:Uncharacterized protein n=1 Tax=Candidatus Schekmanbacteria bacterium RBG_13_48_7 TaxID=1817878 RepID=A0A1F7S028_9BACT|nr:MAG: hypothetical protein A2161_18285 [Candidatus Schekmanbacteria bacterium RBG_13_48_7]
MKQESQRRWREKNPDYWRIDRIEDESTRKALRKRRAAYMREYRKKHPEYVQKDNERRRKAHQEKKQLHCRNKNERFVKVIEVQQLLLDLLPCRNKDVICSHLLSNKGFHGSVSEHLPVP